MGRVRDFLNQDANQAIDQLGEPFVRYMLRHSIFLWLAYPPFVALIWIFVSKTVALLSVALTAGFLLWGVARVFWERRLVGVEAVVLGPGEGERLNERIVVTLEQPQISINEVDVGPDFEGPGPHFHREHVDAFYVLEGTLEFINGTETVRAESGTSVAVPPGIVHGFTNAGPGRARYLNIHAPDGRFIEYLRHAVAGEKFEWDSYDVDEPSGAADAIIAGPGEGELFERPKAAITLRAQTRQIAVLLFEVDAGWGPVDTHVHEDHVDSFYVLDGELILEVEGEEVRLGPGGFAAAPPGVRHGIGRMETSTRFLNFHAPDTGFVDSLRGG